MSTVETPNLVYISNSNGIYLSNKTLKRLKYVLELKEEVTTEIIDSILGLYRMYNINDNTEFEKILEISRNCIFAFDKKSKRLVQRLIQPASLIRLKSDLSYSNYVYALYQVCATDVDNSAVLNLTLAKTKKSKEAFKEAADKSKLISKITKDYVGVDRKYVLQLVKNELKKQNIEINKNFNVYLD